MRFREEPLSLQRLEEAVDAARDCGFAAISANDHFVFTGRKDDDKQTAIGREFARLHGIEKPFYATAGDGI